MPKKQSSNKPGVLTRGDKIKIYGAIIGTFALMVLAGYFSYTPSSKVFGNVFTSIKTKDKVLALTFDDGPNGDTSNQVLDILKQKDVKATFFVIGENVKYYPDIAKRMVADGHEIGNHTTHHKHLLQLENYDSIVRDLQQTNQIVSSTTGVTPRFFRPPFGFRTPWALDYTAKNDLTVINYIEKYAHPGGVIVLHDGSGAKHGVKHDVMVQALPKIIDDLKQQGYRFVTVSELYDTVSVK
jgi:peptidoglycan/xylan/chitin deacetylase (PgdA/CDA1 family)